MQKNEGLKALDENLVFDFICPITKPDVIEKDSNYLLVNRKYFSDLTKEALTKPEQRKVSVTGIEQIIQLLIEVHFLMDEKIDSWVKFLGSPLQFKKELAQAIADHLNKETK